MGVLFFVLNASFALIIILFVLWTSISTAVAKNPEIRYQPMQDDRGSFIKSVNDLHNELDALGATARGDGSKGRMGEKDAAPGGWNARQDLRDSDSRLLAVPTSGFSGTTRAESPLSKGHSTSNWQKGVGY